MLDQRRAEEKGYITLKEAAQISNYTPDYIGQLIRAGKIHGEQVYSNVAWVTTEDEIQAYLKDKSRSSDRNDNPVVFKALSERVFYYMLYALIAFLAVTVLVLQYIFYVSLDNSLKDRHMSSVVVEDQS